VLLEGLALDMGVLVEVEVIVEVELEVAVAVEVEVDEGVGVEVEEGVGVLVGVSVLVLVGVGVGDEVLMLVLELELELEVAELVGTETVSEEVLPLPSFSKTTICAVSPFGTVTTQPVAPPAPTKGFPIISLTELTAGSILQGRPLQPSPSHSISIPNSGLTSRKGVVGSR
jgi:hypothetical protein